jgi:hypothetical protein
MEKWVAGIVIFAVIASRVSWLLEKWRGRR